MATTFVWNWGCKEPIEVSKRGVINNNAQRAFTAGQCHALALAIHERTNWRIVGICDRWDTSTSPGHIAVLTPDGDTLDINGRGAKERWERRWGTCDLVPLTAKQVLNLKGYMTPILEAARPFVPKLVKAAGFKVPRTKQSKQLTLAFAAGCP